MENKKMYTDILKQQAGTERIVAKYKPFNRSMVVSSHWANVDEMLAEAKERFGIIQWYQIDGQEKIFVE
jgi:hypothetical protein